MKNYYEEIFDYVNSLTIIDSHEHLSPPEDVGLLPQDVLGQYLMQYFDDDLLTAGLKKSELAYVIDPKKPLMDRWKVVEPYWKKARNTGYGRVLDLTAKSLYGIDRIDGDSIESLNEKFLKTLETGHEQYHKVLKEMSNIEYCVLGSQMPHYDPAYFRCVGHMDPFYTSGTWNYIEEVIEKEVGFSIHSFGDWLDACEAMLDIMFKQGVVALKAGIAYSRSLLFENVSTHTAEEEFQKILMRKGRSHGDPGAFQVSKAFQDYMMHYHLKLANRRGLVYQFHTGIQANLNNYISNSDPTLLSNLFIQYPNVTFDLFHIGYPYQHTFSALGKMFPNVHLDMCWGHIISPTACVNALDEWLDSVPVNKITAFGGDYAFVDAIYAHQLMARQNVSKVLAKKVEEGVFELEEAKWMAKRMFYDNPKELYGE